MKISLSIIMFILLSSIVVATCNSPCNTECTDTCGEECTCICDKNFPQDDFIDFFVRDEYTTKTLDLETTDMMVEIVHINTEITPWNATIDFGSLRKVGEEGDIFYIGNLSIKIDEIIDSSPDSVKLFFYHHFNGTCTEISTAALYDLGVEELELSTPIVNMIKNVQADFKICNLKNETSEKYMLQYKKNDAIAFSEVQEGLFPNKCDNVQVQYHASDGENVFSVQILNSDKSMFNDANNINNLETATAVASVGCYDDSDCDDNEPSTADICEKSRCEYIKIIECIDDDGFCPKGCVASNDNNCDECFAHYDCDDQDPDTLDYCVGSPKKCTNQKYYRCGDVDNVCPDGCAFPDDEDCDQCTEYEECNDDDPYTIDTCKGYPKRCAYTPFLECMAGDGLCPSVCGFLNDTDCNECQAATDCDNGDACFRGLCAGEPSRCIFERHTYGCGYNGECVANDVRIDGKICEDNMLSDLAQIGDTCYLHEDCASDYCDVICRKSGFVRNMIKWFKGLF